MSTPILATKLYIPPPRSKVIPRPHLIERLNQGLQLGHKLTLISAPAGFGKTTLLGEWVNQKAEGGRRKAEKSELHPSSFIMQPSVAHPSRVAWLSLDEGDSDLTRFLTYFIAALQVVVPGIGEEMQAVLRSP